MLDVRLLGEARVVAEDGRDVRVAHSRTLELLGYLVTHAGVPQQRRSLAYLMWADSDESQARTNLRRELHNLRSVVGDDPSLDVQPTTLTWRDQPSCRVDVRTFERERATAATGDVSSRRSHAEQALAAYGGDFLPGYSDEWVLDARDVLRHGCADLCARAVADLRSTGDLTAAVDVARRRVRLLPLEESGYRVLIEVLVELGDRAAAKATYRQLADVLRRELDLAPDPATTALLDGILAAGAAPSRTSGIDPGHRGDPAAPAFVGRARELDALLQQWRLAEVGERSAVVVCGEPGVGKSRLVAEVAAIAASDGAVVATSRCFGQSGRLALAPVADWLRSGGLAQGLAALEPVWRAEVDRLLPRPEPSSTVGSALPQRAPQPEADGGERLRFFEGLARATLCVDRPTLLVLDDLQWCDQETVSWLAYLLECSRDRPLMVAATARRGALEDLLAVTTALRAFRTSCPVRELDLAPLEMADATALAVELTGQRLETKDEQLLHAATGGYPLFIVEAARRPLLEGADPVADVASVLRRRLEECSAPTQGVARLAAAIGRDFSLDLLVEASDLRSGELVDAVEELTRCGILVEHAGRYDFSHDLLRDAAYSTVSAARRWLLHRRLAQGLELLHVGGLDAVAAQLADQYRRGGRPDRALPYHRRAADVAVKLYANAEAVRQHEQSLELIRELPAGRERDDLELGVLQALSAPLNALQGYASAGLLDVLERSTSLAERLGRPDVLVRNLVGLFAVRFVRGYPAEAHEFASRALALAVGDPDLAGQAHFAFGGSSTSLGMLESAVEHFDVGSAAATSLTPLVVGTRPEVHAVAWSAHAAWLLGDEAGAAGRSLDAVCRGRLVEQPYSLAIALAYAAITDQLRGDLDALGRDVSELRALCRRHEFAYYAEWGLILEGWALGGERGVRMVRLGIRSLRGQGALARMPYWLTLLADALEGQGADDAAQAVLDAAVVVAEQRDERWWLPEALRRRAVRVQGPDAVAQLERARAIAAGQSSTVLARRCELDLAARGVRRAGRTASASRTPAPYPAPDHRADRARGAADRGA